MTQKPAIVPPRAFKFDGDRATGNVSPGVGVPENKRAQLYAGFWEIEPQYCERHVSPGCIPGWRERSEQEESAIRGLRPALCGVFPSRCAYRLRSRHGRRRRYWDPRRWLRSVYCCRHRRLRDFRYAFLLFRKQRSHEPQRLHFFFQPRQFHLFLPQNFIDIFHSQGTRTFGRWIEDPTSAL